MDRFIIKTPKRSSPSQKTKTEKVYICISPEFSSINDQQKAKIEKCDNYETFSEISGKFHPPASFEFPITIEKDGEKKEMPI